MLNKSSSGDTPGATGDEARSTDLLNSKNDFADDRTVTDNINTVDIQVDENDDAETGSDNELSQSISKSTLTKRKITSNSMMDSTLESERDIEKVLKDDNYSMDILWCFFVAAARSYRFNSILHPFPPMYQIEDTKNMFALKTVISSMPKLSSSAEFWSELNLDCQKLLSWVFNAGSFMLKLQDKNMAMKLVKEITGQVGVTAEPSHVFEVIFDQENEDKFETLRNGRECFYAYHGSRFDNFFSILHNGLNTDLNKISLYGEGTYLSSELSVSLMYSQAAEVAQNSSLGSRLSCVAVCQMIDDPSVKCQIKKGSALKQRKRATASQTTDPVPEKYYVVQRNDVIRVKYLLIYREESKQAQKAISRSSSWFREHKFILLMLGYILLLVAIGIANSRQTKIYMDRFWRFIK